jgi:hypothetical protein
MLPTKSPPRGHQPRLSLIKHEKVLEKLATSDKVSLIAERQPDVTSGSWDREKVILRDQVLEVRNVDGSLHVARKSRRHDEWDPFFEPYDPYGPGAKAADEFIED